MDVVIIGSCVILWLVVTGSIRSIQEVVGGVRKYDSLIRKEDQRRRTIYS